MSDKDKLLNAEQVEKENRANRSKKKQAAKKAELRKRRNRARRLTLMVLITLVAAGVGIYSVTQVWYTTNIPTMTVVDRNLLTVEGVSASGSITGWDITHQEVAAPLPTMGQQNLQPPVPGSLGDIPLTVAFLGALAAFTLAGGIMRQGILTGAGVLCGFFAWKEAGTVRSIMENPNFGGSFNTPGPGVAMFQNATGFAILMLVLVTMQVVFTNADRRRIERERAKKAGEEVLPTLLEVVHGMALSQVGRYSTVSNKVSKAEDKAGKDDLAEEATEKPGVYKA